MISHQKFEPEILGFLCNWCSYAGADLAGRLSRAGRARAVAASRSGTSQVATGGHAAAERLSKAAVVCILLTSTPERP